MLHPMSETPIQSSAERLSKVVDHFDGEGCILTFANQYRHRDILWDVYVALSSNDMQPTSFVESRPTTQTCYLPTRGHCSVTERGDGMIEKSNSIGNYQSDDTQNAYFLLFGADILVHTDDETDANLGPPRETRFTVRGRTSLALQRGVRALIDWHKAKGVSLCGRSVFFDKRVEPILHATLDGLVSRGDHWLAVTNDSEVYCGARRFLRAAQGSWFDLIVVCDGNPILVIMDDVAALLARTALFEPLSELRANRKLLSSVLVPPEFIERATFVDEQFESIWAQVDQGTLEVQCDDSTIDVMFRMTDGRLCEVRQGHGAVRRTLLLKRQQHAYWLRRRLWAGTAPHTRPVSQALRAKAEQAVAVETILRANRVEVTLDSEAGVANYLLQDNKAFVYADTGSEEPAPWGVPVLPTPIFEYCPCDRTALEETLRAQSTHLRGVDYGDEGAPSD